MSNGNGLHIKAAWRSLSLSDMRLLPSEAVNNVQYYFTGKPCIHGHTTARYSKTRTCCECSCNFSLKKEANKRFRDGKVRDGKVKKPKLSIFGITL